MTVERENAFTLHGTPLTILGGELKTGDTAPEFVLRDKAEAI